MKRLLALALALSISLSTFSVSFATYKDEYEAIYTSTYSELLITLEKDIADTDKNISETKKAVFYYLYYIQKGIIANTLDSSDSGILKEIENDMRSKLGLASNQEAPDEVKTAALVKVIKTFVDNYAKEIDAQQDGDLKNDKIKEATPYFNYVQTELTNTIATLTSMYGQTQIYTGVSVAELSQTNIQSLKDTLQYVTDTISKYNTGAGNGIVMFDLEKDFNADDLYNSIYSEKDEKLYKTYLEAMAITSTLEPFMSVPSDMLLYDSMSDNTRQLITKYGKKRKPLFVTESSTAFDDFAADKQMSVRPATLRDIISPSKSGTLLFYKTGNDNLIADSNTVAATPNTAASAAPSSTGVPDPNAQPTTTTQQDTDTKELEAPMYVATSGNWLDQLSAPSTKKKRIKNDSTLLEQTNAATNYALLTNVCADTIVKNEEMDSFLFTDIFGNILLANDTVVIPGIANATMYEPNTQYPMTTKYAYNHYSNPSEELFKGMFSKTASSTKWGISPNTVGDGYEIFKLAGNTQTTKGKMERLFEANRITRTSNIMPLMLDLPYELPDTKKNILLYTQSTEPTGTGRKMIVRTNKTVSMGGVSQRSISLSYFESDPDSDELLVKSNLNALQANMLELRHTKMATLAVEVSKGRDTTHEYSVELGQGTEAVTKMEQMLRAIVSPLLTIANKVRGFTQLQDPATNFITKWIIEYRAIITALAIVAAMILLLHLYSADVGIGLLGIATALFVGVFALGIDMVIDYAVIGYNNVVGFNLPFVNDDGSLYRTMGLAEEQRLRRDGATNTTEIDSSNRTYTDSLRVTLHRYPREEMVTKLIPMDLGMFQEGCSVKIGIDDLFSTVSITDNEVMTNGNLSREVVMYKNYDTYSIENYTMFYSVVEQLTKRMTMYSEIAQPQPKSLRYSNNIAKRAYMWKSMADSVLILDYSELYELKIPQSIKDKAASVFPPNDTFNLHDMEIKVFENAENTEPLVGKLNELSSIPYNSEYTIAIHRQYDDYPDMYEQNYTDFVNRANIRIKDYLVNNYESVTIMSDETVTKIVALIVMEEYNKAMTSPLTGKWLYPINIDSSSLSIEKALFSTVDDLSWYNLSSVGLIDMISSTTQLLGYILLIIAIPPIMACLFLASILPFILIVLLIAVLFVRIFLRQELVPLFKGFVRMLTTTIIIAYIMAKSILTIGPIGPKLLILTILSLIMLDILVGVIKSILSDFYTMGYSTYSLNMANTATVRGFDRLTSFIPTGKRGRNNSSNQNSYKIASDMSNLSTTDRIMNNPITQAKLRKFR